MTARGMYEVCLRVTIHKTVVVNADGFDEAEYMAAAKVKLDETDIDTSYEPEVLWVGPVKYEGE